MTKLTITLIMLVLSIGLFAQWSSDPAVPNQINSLTDTQVMPKVTFTSTGNTWIAWMDILTGTYYTYLQLLTPEGVNIFTNPLLVSSNLTDTWLTEWDISCDPAGNAVLIFQDIRSVTNNVVIYKISPAGEFLWGPNGIMLSNDSSTDFTNMAPTLCCLDDGRTIAAWQHFGTTTSVKLQSLSFSGMLQWGPEGLTLSPVTGSYTWPQLLPADSSNVLLKYYEDTGPVWAPTRHILAQKYDAQGNAQWVTPTIIQAMGGISAWTQWLSIASDRSGGMLIAWHEDRNGENISYSYVQHITSDGSVTMPVNGARVSTEQGMHQFYPKLAFEPVLQEVYVFWNRENGDQNMWALQTQKLSLDGERLWGDTGLEFVALDQYPTFPIDAVSMESGVVYLYAYGPFALNDQISNLKAYGISPSGSPIWEPGLGYIATTNTNKLHFDNKSFSPIWGVLVWEDGSTSSNILAMRYNYNGSVGFISPIPFNLTAQVINQNDVWLAWEFPTGVELPMAYNVYRNDVFYHQVVGAMQDTLFDLGPGIWSFKVTAMFANNQESSFSNEATINITPNVDPDNVIIPLTVNAYPNPFRQNIVIHVKGLSALGEQSLAIYNLKGQLVRKLQFTNRKEIQCSWDGRDENRVPVTAGIYLLRLSDQRRHQTLKLVKF